MDNFQQFLVEQGHIQKDDLQRALSMQGDTQEEFGKLCLQKKYMTVKQVMEVLQKRAEMKVHFGSLAVICGFLKEEQRREIQKQLPPPLSAEQALVKSGAISPLLLRAAKAAFEAAKSPANAPTVAVPSSALSVSASASTATPEETKTVHLADLMLLTDDAIVEIREDLENDLGSLESLLLGNLSSDLEGFGRAAFHANRIRGAATVRELPWLPEVAKAIEQVCLQSQSKRPKDISGLCDLLFRGTDAMRKFLESLGTKQVQLDHAWYGQLQKHLETQGAEAVTQAKVDAALGKQGDATIAPAMPVGARPLEGKKLLVVDDNKLVRNSLQRFFVSHGASVETAEHGADGITRIEAAGNYDLLVVDIHMPVMDGFGLVEFVRKSARFAETPIVMFTASLSMDDVRRARDLRVDGYLLKNAPKEELVNKVAGVLTKRQTSAS